jgi:hypothetical protein
MSAGNFSPGVFWNVTVLSFSGAKLLSRIRRKAFRESCCVNIGKMRPGNHVQILRDDAP